MLQSVMDPLHYGLDSEWVAISYWGFESVEAISFNQGPWVQLLDITNTITSTQMMDMDPFLCTQNTFTCEFACNITGAQRSDWGKEQIIELATTPSYGMRRTHSGSLP
jgi:hypothetical protein